MGYSETGDRLFKTERVLGNLLARIFGDGGHKQQEIGDIAEAGKQAEAVVILERQNSELMTVTLQKLVAQIALLENSVNATKGSVLSLVRIGYEEVEPEGIAKAFGNIQNNLRGMRTELRQVLQAVTGKPKTIPEQDFPHCTCVINGHKQVSILCDLHKETMVALIKGIIANDMQDTSEIGGRK